jgi:CheY-like chemotaxis protein
VTNPDAAATSPLRVLLVDDDFEASWALAALLQLTLACQVRTASSGSEAIDEACHLRPHVVVMDLCMPGVDGLETAALLHRMLPDQKPLLIALSALDTRVDRERVLASGFHAHLGKPVDMVTLDALLRNAAKHLRP